MSRSQPAAGFCGQDHWGSPLRLEMSYDAVAIHALNFLGFETTFVAAGTVRLLAYWTSARREFNAVLSQLDFAERAIP